MEKIRQNRWMLFIITALPLIFMPFVVEGLDTLLHMKDYNFENLQIMVLTGLTLLVIDAMFATVFLASLGAGFIISGMVSPLYGHGEDMVFQLGTAIAYGIYIFVASSMFYKEEELNTDVGDFSKTFKEGGVADVIEENGVLFVEYKGTLWRFEAKNDKEVKSGDKVRVIGLDENRSILKIEKPE